jgi:DNA invertase Pin-like site-specific DNA recombinase
VSKIAGREGESFQSPDQQREAIGHAAALAKATIVEEIVDLDESGGTMDRPGVKRALAMLEHGQADGIVVARLDRFGRGLDVPLVLDGLERDGKLFLSAGDQFDTSTPVGKFALGMMVLVAKLERDRHIETWEKSTRNAIGRGVAVRVPYGYERGAGGRLVPAEPAASVVRQMFGLRAAGEAIAAIAAILNAQGAAPPHAAAWTRQTVRAMLRVRTYLGEARYGQSLTVDAHPALVDALTWEAAQSSQGVAQQRGKSLLAGLVRCAGCGYLMGGSSGRGGRRYNCNRVHGGGRCPSPTASMAWHLEAHVTALFLARYAGVGADSAQSSPELRELEVAHDQAQREFEVWRDDVTLRQALGDEHYRAGLVARHENVRVAARSHERAVRSAGAQTLAIDAVVWDDLNVQERRALLTAGIESIVLSRAANNRVPIADRCRIYWVGEPAPDRLVRQGVAGVLHGNPGEAGVARGHDASKGARD